MLFFKYGFETERYISLIRFLKAIIPVSGLSLVSNLAGNMNQIAVANSTGRIYKEDIDELKGKVTRFGSNKHTFNKFY